MDLETHAPVDRVARGRVGEQVVATPLKRGAGAITSLTRADGIVRIPANVEGLAEGARVEVVVKPATPPASPLGEMLLRHAGKAVGLPEDLAAQHDHYLHGTPKNQ